MIEDTLRKLALSIIEERRLTNKINDNTHDDDEDSSNFRTQLDMYFQDTKTEDYYEFTFAEYCEQVDLTMCPKCVIVLELIRERRKVRRRIASLRGSITKYAFSLVEVE